MAPDIKNFTKLFLWNEWGFEGLTHKLKNHLNYHFYQIGKKLRFMDPNLFYALSNVLLATTDRFLCSYWPIKRIDWLLLAEFQVWLIFFPSRRALEKWQELPCARLKCSRSCSNFSRRRAAWLNTRISFQVTTITVPRIKSKTLHKKDSATQCGWRHFNKTVFSQGPQVESRELETGLITVEANRNWVWSLW
jgi:hypothetical protein